MTLPANSPGFGRLNARLTEAQVLEARRRYKPYCRANSAYALAREFGVHHATMDRAIWGLTWRDVGEG